MNEDITRNSDDTSNAESEIVGVSAVGGKCVEE
jgi:hypothetical protein